MLEREVSYRLKTSRRCLKVFEQPTAMEERKTFAELTRDRSPRPLLVRALTHVAKRDKAVDLGAGALNESRYLLDEGFRHVTAIDHEPPPPYAAELPKDRFRYVSGDMEDYSFPDAAFDLAIAFFSLPFLHPEVFARVFAEIAQSIKTGGIFAGQLFGERDDWSDNPKMTFHSAETTRELFRDFRLIELAETEEDGKTVRGDDKHWHIFYFLYRK